MTEGELKKRIRKITLHGQAKPNTPNSTWEGFSMTIDTLPVEKILDEAKKEYLAIDYNFISRRNQWFKKWFGEAEK